MASNFHENFHQRSEAKKQGKLFAKQADELHISGECSCIELWKTK